VLKIIITNLIWYRNLLALKNGVKLIRCERPIHVDRFDQFGCDKKERICVSEWISDGMQIFYGEYDTE